MAPELADATGAPIWLHPADEPVWNLTHPHRRWDHDLADGQEFTVGSVTLQVIHTPGHAPGAVCLYAPELGCVFTGDTLFAGSCGRTDFAGGSMEVELQSLAKIAALPGDYEVYPGHEGSTSLEYERRFNPYMLRPWDL